MQIGIDSFAAILPDPATGKLPSATERMAGLLEEVEVADQAGLNCSVAFSGTDFTEDLQAVSLPHGLADLLAFIKA